MKYYFTLIFILIINNILFSQNKQTVEKDLKEIVNYLKNNDLVSYLKKHQSYDQKIAGYLESGDTILYTKISDSVNYKYYNGLYNNQLISTFFNCRKKFNTENKKIKIDWKYYTVKEIFIDDEQTSFQNKEMSYPVQILIYNTKENNYKIANTSLTYSKSGVLISFRILDNIISGFSSISEYTKHEKNRENAMIANSQVKGFTIKKSELPTQETNKQYQKTYISQNHDFLKFVLIFEDRDNRTFLQRVDRTEKDIIKNQKSYSRWEEWEGVAIFNPYGSKITAYMYEEENKLICFSYNYNILDINKIEKDILTQTKIENL